MTTMKKLLAVTTILVLTQTFFQLTVECKRSGSDDEVENSDAVIGTNDRLAPFRSKVDLFRNRHPGGSDPESSPQVLSPTLSNTPYTNLGGGVLGGTAGLGGLGGYQNPYLAQQYLNSGLGLGGAAQQIQEQYQSPYLRSGYDSIGLNGLQSGLGGLGGYGAGGLGGGDLYSGLGGLGGYQNPYLAQQYLNSGLGIGGAGLLGNGGYNQLLYRNALLSAGNPYLGQSLLNPYTSYSQLNPYNSFPLAARFGIGAGATRTRLGLGGGGTSSNNSDE